MGRTRVGRKERRPARVQRDMTLVAAPPPLSALDPDAFVALLREHDRLLRSLVSRLLGGSTQQMDDVLQEVYLKAFRARDTFRGESAAGTWLYRIAYHACLDELRKAGRWRPEELDETLPDPRLEPGDEVALRGDVAAALAALPVEQRAAVLLVDLHGLDYAAAAAAVGCPTGTLAARVSRGRAALRRLLTEGTDR